MILFLGFFFSLLTLSSALVFKTVFLPVAHLFPAVFYFHLAAYILAGLCFFGVIFERARQSRRASPWVGAYFFIFLGIHSLLFVGALISMALVFGGVALGRDVPVSSAAAAGLLISYFLAILGWLTTSRGPRFVRLQLHESPGSRPLRIVQISDLHIGTTQRTQFVKRVVDQILEEKPDCIVLTGDIGDGDPELHLPSLRELGRLKAPLGVYGILGNHELYWQAEEWSRHFTAQGIQMLSDEIRLLHWNNQLVQLVGLGPEDRKFLKELELKDSHPLIVLAHYPHRADEAIEAGARLFLAGHTHGGQFWPWSWAVHLFHRYSYAHYQVKKTSIYVSAGTGHWGAPFRFGRRAEIVLVELGI